MNFQALHRQRKFIFLAAIAGLIAMFLPWVTVSAGNVLDGLGGGANGASPDMTGLFDKSALSSSENGMHGTGIIVFLSFLATLALSLVGDQTRALQKTNWLLAIVTGGAALLFSIVLLVNTPTGSLGFVRSSIGYGAWIALLASAGMLASAWMLRNPGDTLKDALDQLKKDMAFPAASSQQQKNQ
jgi:hypothetical protein